MKSTGNEIAASILWILVGFWILHIIQGTGTVWLKSFFSAGTPTTAAGTAVPITGTATGSATGSVTNPTSAKPGGTGTTPGGVR